MKVFVAVAVIAAFCAVQIDCAPNSLNTLTAGITRQKNTVQSRNNELERHGRNFISDVNQKVSNARSNSLQEINNVVNPALAKIRNATDEATAEGKDGDSCYEPARVSLRQYSLDANPGLQKCSNTAISSANPTKNNIDATVATGKQVISHLDSIVPSCFSTSTQQMESCIINKLPQSNQQVKSYQTAADAVTRTTSSASNNAYISAVNCNRDIVSVVRQGAVDVQIASQRCVAAL